jgi:hypothetical protein
MTESSIAKRTNLKWMEMKSCRTHFGKAVKLEKLVEKTLEGFYRIKWLTLAQ